MSINKSQINVYKNFGFYINGAWVNPENNSRIQVINPANGKVIGDIPQANSNDIENALNSAINTFSEWKKTVAWDRAVILKKAADLIRERAQVMAEALTLEQGKPLGESLREVGMAADHCEWAAEESKRIYSTIINARPAGTKSMVYREPVGVVAAFTPWNFPALQFGAKVPYALAAGCTVIIKPSEETPGISMHLIQALHDAGLPAGAVNMVFGEPSEISTQLLDCNKVRAVSFTGSTAVGKLLMSQAANGLQKLTMELGGHAPLIVCEDANPVDAAKQAAAIKFRNAGQACVSPSRFFVHEKIVDAFTKELVKCAESLKIGDGSDEATNMGPLINERRLSAVKGLVDDAIASGAKLETGGKQIDGSGYFFQPTVLTQVSNEAKIMNIEPFGPIAPITSFTDIDQALDEANRLEYGLAAYLFTASQQTAEYCSERIEAGMVGVNNFALAIVETPFGGVKSSGFGREGGQNPLDEYLSPKLVKTIF